MASSDDEGEAVPHTVSNYYFVDGKDEPVAFSELPVQWKEGEELGREWKQVFLHGTADDGLQKVYKQVIAWKFDLSDMKPELFVRSKENYWIKLQKPRKSFEDIIRSILISLHCLHFLRKYPEASGRPLWDHLSRAFSSYEIRPSETDLVDHTSLISEALKRDAMLAKSKYLLMFLEKPRKKKILDQETGTTPASRFIVDDDMVDEVEEDDGSDEEQDLFDSVCAICDNGGELLSCGGSCMRSFHPTVEAGSESGCESLGFSAKQVEEMPNFLCKNCQLKQHQCFACGELGSSDKLSGAEVFKCVTATCGRFYHPHCVAKLLHHDNAAATIEFQKKVLAGDNFTCPIHKCIVCKQGEDKTNPDLQFAVCRRCPKSYHRKCLPRRIAFEDMEDDGILQRAWEDLIPNRILIYCLKHEIDEELATPLRNHLKFPGDEPKMKKLEPQQLSSTEKVTSKKRSLSSEDEMRKRTVVKLQKGAHLPTSVKEGNTSKKIVRRLSGFDSLKKWKGADMPEKQLGDSCLGAMLHNYMNKRFKDSVEEEQREKVIENPVVSSSMQLDGDSKQRIMALAQDATSSVTLEDILEKHKLPKTHGSSMKHVVDKTITLGKVQGSVEAVRAALQKLEEGGSVEDAKAVCEPGVLHQIVKWKNKLRLYLAPFLYGMRYTSFGRHFTKVEKLKEIVNVLHPYVQDGDMIVDFCCGANDFSWLTKMKLDEIGKKCSYKNFDILQAKNDFNFERRDWMSVQTKELPAGSRLIMGLNPPFGVNASLANTFIDKALEFKPKLLILIVPKETERLDKKEKMPYDLIWEDDELLAGKSFYLPGSVDINDNQLEDWNVSTPPLYLWSRPDWTPKHMAIAQQHGHLSRVPQLSHQQEEKENCNKSLAPDPALKDDDLDDAGPMPVDDHPGKVEAQFLVPEAVFPNTAKLCKEGNPDDDDKEFYRNQSSRKDQRGEGSKQRVHDKVEHVRESGKKTPDKSKEREQHVKESGRGLQKSKKRGKGKKHRIGAPSEREISNERDRHLGPNMAGLDSHLRTGYGGVSRMDERERSYGLTSEEPYLGVTPRWPVGSTGPSPGHVEHFPGYRTESIDGHIHRPPPLVGELEEQQYASSSVSRSRVGFYAQDDPPVSLSQRSSFMGSGLYSGYPSLYSSRMGHGVDPRMSTTSAMQRYAPRLDELNGTRLNSPGYDQFAAAHRPGPTSQPGYLAVRSGFAQGPYRLTQENLSGWINE